MNPGNIIALAAVAAVLGLAVFLLVRSRRKGRSCGCGGSCPYCSGGCASCPSIDNCGRNKKRPARHADAPDSERKV